MESRLHDNGKGPPLVAQPYVNIYVFVAITAAMEMRADS